MTKKHFIELAKALKTERASIECSRRGEEFKSGRIEQWERDRDALADFCARQNPRFDRKRWLAYIAGECGPNGGKRS